MLAFFPSGSPPAPISQTEERQQFQNKISNFQNQLPGGNRSGCI